MEDKRYEDFPPHQTIVHKAEPVYEELEGWGEELGEARSFDELPPAARKYIDRVADLGGVPVRTVSVGLNPSSLQPCWPLCQARPARKPP